jgi:uncharacterized protein with GYD domain
MPVYISRGRFTSDAIKGMLAKPENREDAVAKLFKSVGGKLIGWYLTFGHHDWMAIGEFPDEKAAASAILAAGKGGHSHLPICGQSRQGVPERRPLVTGSRATRGGLPLSNRGAVLNRIAGAMRRRNPGRPLARRQGPLHA